MIEEYLMERAKIILPDLEWTVNYSTGTESTGAVYYEGGPMDNPNNETELRYPQYMFYFQSSKKNWDESKIAAYKVYDLFHKWTLEELVHVPELEKSYRVYYIQALGEPIRVGEEKGVMEYSLNIQVTLREEI